MDLWSYWRQQVRFARADTIVLLGSSRMHLDFSPDAWLQRFPHQRVVQLAIENGGSLPVLQNLADDPSFGGTVLCEMWDQSTLTRDDTCAEEWVEYYNQHKQWIRLREVETRMKGFIQEHFVIATLGPDIARILKNSVFHRKLQPPFVRTRFDRTSLADYSRVPDVSQRMDRWIKDELQAFHDTATDSKKSLPETTRSIGKMVRQIESRGGRVVFVRLPTSGQLRQVENQCWPKEKVWDEFAKRIGNDAIHFEDVPSMRGFVCPDGSHLDQRDSRRFTIALADELVRRGLIGGSSQFQAASLESAKTSVSSAKSAPF